MFKHEDYAKNGPPHAECWGCVSREACPFPQCDRDLDLERLLGAAEAGGSDFNLTDMGNDEMLAILSRRQPKPPPND